MLDTLPDEQLEDFLIQLTQVRSSYQCIMRDIVEPSSEPTVKKYFSATTLLLISDYYT